MPKVAGLGHVGLYAKDMPAMVEFYSGFLGLQITDRGPEDGIVFLSANPQEEHHEVALVKAGAGRPTQEMQQVSFRVASLADLKQFYSQILERGHRVDRLSNHGIALGIYFFDPEGNRLELYWRTGKEYPQPHNEPIDLNLSEPELLRILEQMPAKTAV